MSDSANQIQIGGNHYKGKALEAWDYIHQHGLGFFDGTAIKYLTRWRKKGGVEDLKKAAHYIQKLIELETQNKGFDQEAAYIEERALSDRRGPGIGICG